MIEAERQQVVGRWPGARWWLICKDRSGRFEPLVVGWGQEASVAVFSFQEEAEMLLWVRGLVDEGWRIRETREWELISVLVGLRNNVWRVALDPLPEMLIDETVGLVSIGRRRFLEYLLKCSRSDEPTRSSGRKRHHRAGRTDGP